MRISEYIYLVYTKGAFVCADLEHDYAIRAEEAIVRNNLAILSEPLAAPYKQTPYIYTSEEVQCVCCRLGLILLVKRVLAVMGRLLDGGQIQNMLKKVTSDENEQAELLARVAFTIDRGNPIFLKGNVGLLREGDLQKKLLESGILGLVHVMLEE